MGVRHAIRLCELFCKRNRLQEELNLLSSEMQTYMQRIEQHIATITARRHALVEEQPFPAPSAQEELPYGGYTLVNVSSQQQQQQQQPLQLDHSVTEGFQALLLEAERYYLDLKEKGRVHLGEFLDAAVGGQHNARGDGNGGVAAPGGGGGGGGAAALAAAGGGLRDAAAAAGGGVRDAPAAAGGGLRDAPAAAGGGIGAVDGGGAARGGGIGAVSGGGGSAARGGGIGAVSGGGGSAARGGGIGAVGGSGGGAARGGGIGAVGGGGGGAARGGGIGAVGGGGGVSNPWNMLGQGQSRPFKTVEANREQDKHPCYSIKSMQTLFAGLVKGHSMA